MASPGMGFADDDDGPSMWADDAPADVNDDDDDEPSAAEAASRGADEQPAGERELVPDVRKVEKIDINYAKRAKKVDIKALKESVWTLVNEVGAKAKAGKDGWREVSFQEILGRLHTKVPKDQLEEVSFAYCFICLLHLCNERGLETFGTGDLTEMRVKIPPAA